MSTPNYPAEHLLNLALDSLRSGRFAEAEARFERVLAHDPSNAFALHQWAMIAYDRGDRVHARELLARAVDLAPTDTSILLPFGQVLHELSQPREALDIFLRVLAVDNTLSDVWNAAGICFQETAQPAQAIEFYLHALTLRPDYPEALNNLGVVLTNERDPDGAIQHFQQALALRPDYAECLSNLGAAFRNRLDYASAIAALTRARSLQPQSADIAAVFGELLSLLYDDRALSLLQQAADLRPTDPEKRWNLALEQLKRGDYRNGFAGYESRWQRPRNQHPLPAFTQPFWLNQPGQSLKNSTILLHSEQGFGDAIQFLRYLPLVLAESANAILQVPQPLLRLTQSLAGQFPGRVQVILDSDPKPPFDWHIPLMSLPHAFATTLETVPPPLRFTPAPPPRQPNQPLRVGIAWSGNPLHERDRERSIPFDAILPLLETPGIHWVSLQTGPAASHLDNRNINGKIDRKIDQKVDRKIDQKVDGKIDQKVDGKIDKKIDGNIDRPTLTDFLSTTHLLDTLDLVLTVDTALAHLSASQGIPTWILLPYVADWRWLRPTFTQPNPWYPNARLFRQPPPSPNRTQSELWQPVITELIQTLCALSAP